jgi:integrase
VCKVHKGKRTRAYRFSAGHGAYWTKAIAEADDFDESNGKILTFFEAQDVAKKMARAGDGSADTAPITVDDALNDYRRDLISRSANPYNADWPRLHLTSVLLSKPAALLAATELKKWRDSLLGAMAPSTINRLCRCLCAALELAAQHDERIQNRQAWEIGLAGLPDAQEARNVIISDEKVREFVATAYGLDGKFGLLADTLAITGARPSQAVRLRVEDLHDHPVRPETAN